MAALSTIMSATSVGLSLHARPFSFDMAFNIPSATLEADLALIVRDLDFAATAAIACELEKIISADQLLRVRRY